MRLETFSPFPKGPKPKTIDGGVMIALSLKTVSFLETIGERDATSSSKKLQGIYTKSRSQRKITVSGRVNPKA